MRLRNGATMIRHRGNAANGGTTKPKALLETSAAHTERARAADAMGIIAKPEVEDALGRVVTELSHDLRQPLTSLHMNLQSAVKLLRQPVPHVPAALEALTDCLSTERDMIELLTHANRRAAAFSRHDGSFALNHLARDIVLTAQGLEPGWRLRLTERLTMPSPIVPAGILRLRLALLSALRRAL